MKMENIKKELVCFINDVLLHNQSQDIIYEKKLINKPNNKNIDEFSIFYVDKNIKLTLIDYIERITKYFGGSIVCYIYALIYIDKLIYNNPYLYLKQNNVYLLFSISLLCAYKFIDDNIENNEYFSRLFGVSLKELNSMEIIFLNKINYELFIENNVFNEYLQKFPKNIINLCNDKSLHR